MIRAAATIPLVVGGLAVLTPGTAEAATCGQSWSDKDKTGYGYGIASSGHPYDVPIRSGIYADCAETSAVSTGVKLWYHCYRINAYGNYWTHIRVDGTNINGWVYNGNLNDLGASTRC